MIVGDFELFTDTLVDKNKTATIRKKHECFELEEDDIYHLEFVNSRSQTAIKNDLNIVPDRGV